jgi:hypothetical protein
MDAITRHWVTLLMTMSLRPEKQLARSRISWFRSETATRVMRWLSDVTMSIKIEHKHNDGPMRAVRPALMPEASDTSPII